MITALCAAAAFIFVNKRLEAKLTLTTDEISLKARIFPLLRLFHIDLMLRLLHSPQMGFYVTVNGGRPRRLGGKKRNKRKKRLDLFSFLRFNDLKAGGELGLEGFPDKSVIAVGALRLFLEEAFLFFCGKPCSVTIMPALDKSAFDLNVEGIVSISPGRLMLETIKAKAGK